ncbi:phage head spike fiber domain-containing protein [Klebsiella pneumoniae]
MATIVKSNMKIKGNIKLPPVNAPLPEGANLFSDFAGSRHVIKHASGNVIRSTKLTDILSFSRASTATRVAESGLLEYLQANEPAIDYHPMSGECLGLRIERGTSNRLAWSQDFTKTATWSASGVVLTPASAVSPDGNLTATKMIEATDTAASVRKLAATTTVDGTKSNPFAFSVFAKANTADVLQLSAVGAFPDPTFVNFDLKNGRLGKASTGSTTRGLLQASIEPFRNGWYRCSIVIIPYSAMNPEFTLALVDNDTSAGPMPSYLPATPKSVFIWGAQAEFSDGTSSYIPTNGAEAQRSNDICTTPTVASFVTAAAGTVLVSVAFPHSIMALTETYGSLSCAAVIDNSVVGPHVRFAYRNANVDGNYGAVLGVVPGATGTAQNLEIPSMAPVPDSEQSCIFSFDATALTSRLFDGYNWYERSFTAAPPALNRLCIGRGYLNSSNYLKGYIKKIIYWPTALSESEMEEILSYQ